MNATRTLLALALLGAAGMAHAAGNCTIALKGDDAMKFDLKEATVSAGCATITIELTHTGKLPATAMGHNVVISKTADLAGLARDGFGKVVVGGLGHSPSSGVIRRTTAHAAA